MYIYIYIYIYIILKNMYKSSNEEASKKLQGSSLGNSASSDVSVNNEDPFLEGFNKSSECVHLVE